jgi:hypothetical protein
MQQARVRTEGERRIRAVVRALLSSGVWLVIAVQVLAAAVFVYRVIPIMSSDAAAVELPGALFLLVALLVLYVYLMSGTSRSFAVGTAVVSAQESLNRGKEVFGAFLLLALKVLVLALIFLYLLGLVVQLISVSTGSDVQTVLSQVGPVIRLMATIAPFALVYWLPVMFVRNDFRAIPTLRAALLLIWQRLWKSGFLAFLAFSPLLVFWLLPAGSPPALMLVLSVVGQLMAWSAYVYCVELLTEGRPVPRAAS